MISYRLAVVKNEGQVALEAGNSPNVIFKNYRALVKEKAAQTWFNIMPTSIANIVELSEAADSVADANPSPAPQSSTNVSLTE